MCLIGFSSTLQFDSITVKSAVQFRKKLLFNNLKFNKHQEAAIQLMFTQNTKAKLEKGIQIQMCGLLYINTDLCIFLHKPKATIKQRLLTSN